MQTLRLVFLTFVIRQIALFRFLWYLLLFFRSRLWSWGRCDEANKQLQREFSCILILILVSHPRQNTRILFRCCSTSNWIPCRLTEQGVIVIAVLKFPLSPHLLCCCAFPEKTCCFSSNSYHHRVFRFRSQKWVFRPVLQMCLYGVNNISLNF